MRTTRPQPEEVAPRLLAWFDRAKRDLPWRRTRDPYRIWVSEVMLQQTQVDRVIGYYRRFLERFPTVRALAAAPRDDVLQCWEGLGYYSRARHLQAAAKIIVERHGGAFPRRLVDAVKLPGVGRYTAGAVLSIAYGERLPAIDANARRVFCRLLLERGDTAASRQRVERFATAAVPEDRPGDYNQSLMDLGATVCVPKGPRCGECPLAGICAANRTGRWESVPAVRRQSIRSVCSAVAVVARGGRVLIARRPPEGVWGGLWEFPHAEYAAGDDARALLRGAVAETLGLSIEVGEPVITFVHGIMDRRIELTAYRCAAVGRTRPRRHRAARWVRSEELGGYPMPSPHRRVAEAVAEDGSSRRAIRRGDSL
jgi:A/G-specific adenine glycosylase